MAVRTWSPQLFVVSKESLFVGYCRSGSAHKQVATRLMNVSLKTRFIMPGNVFIPPILFVVLNDRASHEEKAEKSNLHFAFLGNFKQF